LGKKLREKRRKIGGLSRGKKNPSPAKKKTPLRPGSGKKEKTGQRAKKKKVCGARSKKRGHRREGGEKKRKRGLKLSEEHLTPHEEKKKIPDEPL